MEEAVGSTRRFPELCVGGARRERRGGERRGGGVPAVQETVVLETAAAEEGVVGMESLCSSQRGDSGTWEREGRRGRGRGREREIIGINAYLTESHITLKLLLMWLLILAVWHTSTFGGY